MIQRHFEVQKIKSFGKVALLTCSLHHTAGRDKGHIILSDPRQEPHQPLGNYSVKGSLCYTQSILKIF